MLSLPLYFAGIFHATFLNTRRFSSFKSSNWQIYTTEWSWRKNETQHLSSHFESTLRPLPLRWLCECECGYSKKCSNIKIIHSRSRVESIKSIHTKLPSGRRSTHAMRAKIGPLRVVELTQQEQPTREMEFVQLTLDLRIAAMNWSKWWAHNYKTAHICACLINCSQRNRSQQCGSVVRLAAKEKKIHSERQPRFQAVHFQLRNNLTNDSENCWNHLHVLTALVFQFSRLSLRWYLSG